MKVLVLTEQSVQYFQLKRTKTFFDHNTDELIILGISITRLSILRFLTIDVEQLFYLDEIIIKSRNKIIILGTFEK